MKRIFTSLFLTFSFTLTFCQDFTSSFLDFVINDYLVNRVQTRNFIIQRQLTCLKDLALDNRKDIQPFNWGDFTQINSECKSVNIRKYITDYSFINKKTFDKEINRLNKGIKDPLKNWESFQKNHQNCEAVVSLSCPFVNKDSSKFIIFIDYYSASDKGFGDLIICQKSNNSWTIVKEINITKPLLKPVVIPSDKI